MQSVFISYGGPDEEFARLLDERLTTAGIKTFFFKRHATPGQKLHHVMRNGVNAHDRVVLICSKNSLNRRGVLNEIEEVLQREAREGGAAILIPVTIDDYVLSEWAPQRPGLALAVRDRVVADFRNTTADPGKFETALSHLVEALLEPDEGPLLVENTGGRFVVRILDPAGHKARQTYERTLIPRSDNVSRLMIRDISGSGKIEYISTNIGRLEPPIDEGGKQIVYTVLDSPLAPGKQVTHVVEMLATDCYRSDVESTTFTVTGHYPEISVHVYLPPARPLSLATAWRILDARQVPCPGLVISDDRTEMHLTIRYPKMNATYKVEWGW